MAVINPALSDKEELDVKMSFKTAMLYTEMWLHMQFVPTLTNFCSSVCNSSM